MIYEIVCLLIHLFSGDIFVTLIQTVIRDVTRPIYTFCVAKRVFNSRTRFLSDMSYLDAHDKTDTVATIIFAAT